MTMNNSLKHHITKPEDKLSFWKKTAYGTGMAPFALMVQGMVQMINPIFNDCLGVDPRLVSWVMGGSRIWDAVTDPVMGSVSDNTRSRWGRRRPWIVLGAFFSCITFASIWLFPRGMSPMFYFWWFLGASLIFYLASTMYSVPYIALGMEITPDYHERTSVMAYRTVMSQFGAICVGGFFWFTSLPHFTDRAHGMRTGGIIFGLIILVLGIVPAVFSREHPSILAAGKNKKQKVSLLKSAKETLSEGPFLMLIGVTMLMTTGLQMVASLGYYVAIYYVFGGEKSLLAGQVLTAGQWAAQICTMLAVPAIAVVSRRIGKKATLFLTIALAITGSLLKWICYTPANPWLLAIPGMLMSGGLASTWTLINAMIPDVIDLDELKTGTRREGMYSAVYGWANKSGVAAALIISGYILSGSGFNAALGANQSPAAVQWIRIFFTFIPVVSMSLAILLLVLYPVSEKRSYEVREELRRMRERQKGA